MEFRIVQGIRERSKLLHVLPEDMLYVQKSNRNGVKEWYCYQTILSAPKKNSENNEMKCNARINELPDGKFEIVKPHTGHNYHNQIRRDMEKRNNMKAACKTVQTQYTEDAHKIRVRHIFQREISK